MIIERNEYSSTLVFELDDERCVITNNAICRDVEFGNSNAGVYLVEADETKGDTRILYVEKGDNKLIKLFRQREKNEVFYAITVIQEDGIWETDNWMDDEFFSKLLDYVFDLAWKCKRFYVNAFDFVWELLEEYMEEVDVNYVRTIF